MDNNNRIDVADMLFLRDYVFYDGQAPFPSILLADCDCSGQVDMADAVYMSNYQFSGGPPPIRPCFEF